MVRATQEEIIKQAQSLYTPPAKEEAKPAAKEGPVSPESPALTFASKAINAVGFGLPEYLDKKFGNPTSQGWQSPEERQQIQAAAAEANPNAARYGEITGDVAGMAIPVGYGAKAGYEGVNAIMKGASQAQKLKNQAAALKAMSPAERSLAERAGAYGANSGMYSAVGQGEGLASGLLSGTGKKVLQGAGIGAGAQVGAALPDMAQGAVNNALDTNLPGSFPKGVAKSAEINRYIEKLPVVGSFYGATLGQVVPIGISALERLSSMTRRKDKKE